VDWQLVNEFSKVRNNSETSVTIYHSAWCNIAEDLIYQQACAAAAQRCRYETDIIVCTEQNKVKFTFK
jgi:hypothetical protein